MHDLLKLSATSEAPWEGRAENGLEHSEYMASSEKTQSGSFLSMAKENVRLGLCHVRPSDMPVGGGGSSPFDDVDRTYVYLYNGTKDARLVRS